MRSDRPVGATCWPPPRWTFCSPALCPQPHRPDRLSADGPPPPSGRAGLRLRRRRDPSGRHRVRCHSPPRRGGVIVVSRLGQTTRDAVQHLSSQLDNLEAPLLGVVVNSVAAERAITAMGTATDPVGRTVPRPSNRLGLRRRQPTAPQARAQATPRAIASPRAVGPRRGPRRRGRPHRRLTISGERTAASPRVVAQRERTPPHRRGLRRALP